MDGDNVTRQGNQRSVESVGAGAGSSARSYLVLRGGVVHLWSLRIPLLPASIGHSTLATRAAQPASSLHLATQRFMKAASPLRGLLLAGWLALVGCNSGRSQPLRAVVLSIGDGDTIRVREDGRTMTVRLACIDAPELAQSPYGAQARAYLRQRLPLGAVVTVDIHTKDRYGRLVAEVISDSNLGLALVEDGQAFAYRRYLHGCNAHAYLDAEFRASRHRFGVWEQPGGIPRPWEVRRQRRS